MTPKLRQALLAQYNAHKSWSAQLHHDNLAALAETRSELRPVPSYATVRRFLAAHGLTKRRPMTTRQTDGALAAAARLEARARREATKPNISTGSGLCRLPRYADLLAEASMNTADRPGYCPHNQGGFSMAMSDVGSLEVARTKIGQHDRRKRFKLFGWVFAQSRSVVWISAWPSHSATRRRSPVACRTISAQLCRLYRSRYSRHYLPYRTMSSSRMMPHDARGFWDSM